MLKLTRKVKRALDRAPDGAPKPPLKPRRSCPNPRNKREHKKNMEDDEEDMYAPDDEVEIKQAVPSAPQTLKKEESANEESEDESDESEEEEESDSVCEALDLKCCYREIIDKLVGYRNCHRI